MCFGVFVQVNEGSPRAISKPIGYVIQENGCWEWVGAVNHGYGSWYGRHKGACKSGRAHRRMYELHRGPIPKGLHLDHLCRNRLCVNPDHLEAVTNKENILRGFGAPAQNARKTHCIHGHPYDEHNTYSRAGVRDCRICKTKRDKKRRAKEYAARDAAKAAS